MRPPYDVTGYLSEADPVLVRCGRDWIVGVVDTLPKPMHDDPPGNGVCGILTADGRVDVPRADTRRVRRVVEGGAE